MGKELPVDLRQGDALPLGSRMRLRRRARGIRLSTMARDLSYDRGYLSKVENNVSKPSNEVVHKIADYLTIDIGDLRQGPITQLTLGISPTVGSLAHPSLQTTAGRKKRRVGERIERILTMANVSEAEEQLLAESLVAVTKQLVALTKAARQLTPAR